MAETPVKRWGGSHHGEDTRKEFAELEGALEEMMERAEESCKKCGGEADVMIETLGPDGKPDGGGGDYHRCDLEELMRRYPGRFREMSEEGGQE
jgi:hypothetical protein